MAATMLLPTGAVAAAARSSGQGSIRFPAGRPVLELQLGKRSALDTAASDKAAASAKSAESGISEKPGA